MFDVKMNQNVYPACQVGSLLDFKDGLVYNARLACNQPNWETELKVFVDHPIAGDFMLMTLGDECELANPERDVQHIIECAIETLRELPYPQSRQADELEFALNVLRRFTLHRTHSGGVN